MKILKATASLPLVLAIAVSGCSQEQSSAVLAQQGQHSAVRYAGKLKVQILPAVPTAADDLQLVYTGSGSAVYRWEKNGGPLSGETGNRLASSSFARGDHITAVVSAGGEEGRASLRIENAPPRVVSVTVGPHNIHQGVDITATAVAVDADGDPIRYGFRWFVNGAAVPEDAPVLKRDRFKSGDGVSLRVTPHDGYEAGKEYSTQLFVISNAPPIFISNPPERFKAATYVYEAKAADPEGEAVSYALLSAPPGMTINSATGRIEWQIAGQSQSHSIQIEARDGKGLTAVQNYTFAVTIP